MRKPIIDDPFSHKVTSHKAKPVAGRRLWPLAESNLLSEASMAPESGEFHFRPFGLCGAKMHFIKKKEWLQLAISIIWIKVLGNATATSLKSKILALCPALFPPHQPAVLIALETLARRDIFSNRVLIIFFTEALIRASAKTVTF